MLIGDRILGQRGGQPDWLPAPHYPGSPPVRRHSDGAGGEGLEDGAARHPGPGGLVLPPPGEGRPAVRALREDGEDGTAGLLGQRRSAARSVARFSLDT